ncbi:PREDICTED: uncharacterized protein LOC106750968, partial [Dinoponera quadriceps]|uniref:Uncharacterized protein LOC106750968 n=1 Tax=Dinoponera quadriceps TaxID=609295 RepID=A0A6P3YAY6_DINQU
MKTLPCPQTVRRWFLKVNLTPGIKKERLNNKELKFGLQVDEMSIKKQVEFRNNACYGFVDIGNETKKKLEEASYALVFMI